VTDDGWDEKSDAAAVVAKHVGATAINKRDVPGAPPSTHDFDLIVGDRVIALEVTSATDEGSKHLWKAVRTSSWVEPSLHYSWSLTLRPDTLFGKLQGSGVNHLRQLEERGVMKFTEYDKHLTQSPASRAIQQLMKLGVRNGVAVEDDPTCVVVGVYGPRGWSAPEYLNGTVTLAIDANIERLRNAAADERHLFVWLDSTSPESQAAVRHILSFGGVPDAPPTLPDGLDAVWTMPGAVVGEQLRPLMKATVSGWELIDDS